MARRCDECEHWQAHGATESAATGDCRYRAPVVNVMALDVPGDPRPISPWPTVQADDCCRQFKAATRTTGGETCQ